MRINQNSSLKKALLMINQSNCQMFFDDFVDDFGPDGFKVWRDLLNQRMVYCNTDGKIQLTSYGVSTLDKIP